ncbi:MAG: hypothetical protein IBJ09_04475 [Bacteroidia bacterium]|nr:hypothetical protein [Bacteroidia bacterium]
MHANPKKEFLLILFIPLFWLSCATRPFPGSWKLEALENKTISRSETGRVLTFRPDGELKITLPGGDVRQAYWRWKEKGRSVVLTKDFGDLDAEVFVIQRSAAGELRLLDEKGVISRFSRVPAP